MVDAKNISSFKLSTIFTANQIFTHTLHLEKPLKCKVYYNLKSHMSIVDTFLAEMLFILLRKNPLFIFPVLQNSAQLYILGVWSLQHSHANKWYDNLACSSE